MEEKITFFFNVNTTPDTSSLVVWDTLKAYLRGQIIPYTANMKKKTHKERLELANQIKELELQYALVKDPELYRKRLDLQTKFDILSTYPIGRQAGPPNNKRRLDEPISQEEIAAAISSLQSGKSPGPNVPAEFFKSFSSLLLPLSDSFKQGKLLDLFSEACITLVVKNGKDPTVSLYVFQLSANLFIKC